MVNLDPKREAARAFFDTLERNLRADETLGDKQCVRLILAKARDEQAQRTKKRFDTESSFRQRLLYNKIDDILVAWCRKREVEADPFRVFRYEGEERGPTQHEAALGLARPAIERVFARLRSEVPEFTDCAAAVFKAPTRAIAPAFRLQFPLPFGAVGEVKYAGTKADLSRLVYMVAMYAATGGDTSRGWRYDCGLLIFYTADRLRIIFDEEFLDRWPEAQERLWEAARTRVILL